MNNRVKITFSRNFVDGDSIGVYYSDPSTQTSGYWTFVWVSGTPGAFEVQQGSNTTDTAENFASSWSNSLNGFTVTQPVGNNDNQVQITSQTYHFVNVLAKFADGSTMAIPTDYSYVLSNVTTGNKITYTDKEPLNTQTAPAINLWRADDANEVKEKHNLNDDRIGTLETDMLGKADLVGGNDFTGDQNIEGVVLVESGSDSLSLNSFGLIFNRLSSYIRPISNGDKNLFVGGASSGDQDWSLVRVFASQLDISGNVGIGTTTPSEKLEVKGRIYINPDAQFSGTVDPASAMLFKSKNGIDQTSTIQMIATTTSQDEARMTFKVQSAASSFNSALIISCDSGEVTTRVPVKFDADKTICFSGISRTYNDLPSSPTQGMISYITDANNTSPNSITWRGPAVGGGNEKALVFYDGSGWIYH